MTMTETVRVLPEYNWRDVWHENCTAGDGRPYPMRHLRERLTIEDGSVLRLYQCTLCGVRVFAGLDAQRIVTHRPYTAPSAPAPTSGGA
jgi:hypothetical protein